jgi:hypothetical protein
MEFVGMKNADVFFLVICILVSTVSYNCSINSVGKIAHAIIRDVRHLIFSEIVGE